MTKNYNPVISGRISQSLYDEVNMVCDNKSWSHTKLIEKALNDFVNKDIDGCIHRLNVDESIYISDKQKRVLVAQCESIIRDIEEHKETGEYYIQELKERPFGLLAQVMEYIVTFLDIVKRIGELQLDQFQNNEQDDNQGHDENNKHEKNVWEGVK